MGRLKEQDLCKHIGKALKAGILAKGLGIKGGADLLGVSRQSMYQYISGNSFPSIDVVYRACQKLNITIEYLDFEFRVTPQKRRKHKPPPPTQLSLPYVLSALDDRDLKVRMVKKDSRSLQLELTIHLAS